MLAISPVLLKESRADLHHHHFDTAGAASITGGLMLLVYALSVSEKNKSWNGVPGTKRFS